ncbi:hypothetical protein ACFLZB_00870 [Nanoarchaeota archaeon]
MRIKKAIKKIAALGIGTTMLGATLMGASALADLSLYPGDMVTGSTFNGKIVAGRNSKAIDSIAVAIVAGDMPELAGGGSTVVTTGISGDDLWQVGTVTDPLEIGEGISEVTGFIDGSDLDALGDGTLSNSKGTFEYEQFLYFNNAMEEVLYEESDDDVTDVFFTLDDDTNIARYRLDFTENAESDIDGSDNFNLDDFENKEITMMGETFTIVQATGTTSPSEGVELKLMSGAVKDDLDEEQEETYTIDGETYTVQLTYVDDDEAAFTVNTETTGKMADGETYTLSDGTVLGIGDIYYQAYAGGIHTVTWFLGANSVILQDTNITDTVSSNEVQVNEETIDGADVIIKGTVLDTATSTDDGELRIEFIDVNMTAQDDYWVAAGGKLSDAIDDNGDEMGILFTNNWDIQFAGLSGDDTNEIDLDAKAADDEMWLTFTNLDGDEIEFPVAWTDDTDVGPGAEDDALILRPGTTPVAKDQYFILNDDTDDDSITQVIQYTGSDDDGASNPEITFKNLANGDTITRSWDTTANTATLTLSGTQYTIANATGTGADNFNITISGQAATELGTGGNSWEANYVITEFGGKVLINDTNATDTTEALVMVFQQIDSNRVDELTTPETLATATLGEGSDIVLSVTEGAGLSFVTPEDDDEHSYLYSIYGAWLDLFNPDSGASSFTITMPEQQLEPQLYVTSGATTSSMSSTTTGNKVTVLAAASVLDDEVTDYTAQNLIVVGGPCVNTIAAELMGNPTDCTEGFTPGEAMIKVFETGTYEAILVAGYSGDGTRLAASVLTNPAAYGLSGTEVTVSGPSLSNVVVETVA